MAALLLLFVLLQGKVAKFKVWGSSALTNDGDCEGLLIAHSHVLTRVLLLTRQFSVMAATETTSRTCVAQFRAGSLALDRY